MLSDDLPIKRGDKEMLLQGNAVMLTHTVRCVLPPGLPSGHCPPNVVWSVADRPSSLLAHPTHRPPPEKTSNQVTRSILPCNMPGKMEVSLDCTSSPGRVVEQRRRQPKTPSVPLKPPFLGVPSPPHRSDDHLKMQRPKPRSTRDTGVQKSRGPKHNRANKHVQKTQLRLGPCSPTNHGSMDP